MSMRNLFYVFLIGMLMVSCHNNRYYLNKVRDLYGVNVDSMTYYLLKIDSASLSLEERNEFNYFRLTSSYSYLLSQDKENLDTVAAQLEKYFSTDKEKLFRVGMMRVFYLFVSVGGFYSNGFTLKSITTEHSTKIRFGHLVFV